MHSIRNRYFTTCNLQGLFSSENWTQLKSFSEAQSFEIDKFISGSTYTDHSGLTYSKITDHNQSEVFEMLSKEVTSKEPLAVKLKMTQEEFKRNICENLLLNSHYEDLSLCVYDHEKVVAAFVSVDWKQQHIATPKDHQDFRFWKQKMRPLMSFILLYNGTNPRNSGEVAHGITSAVLEKYCNQGIAKNALAIRLAMARALGFSTYFCEAGYGQSFAFKVYKHYMEYATEMAFKDFKFQGRNILGQDEGGYVVFCRDLR